MARIERLVILGGGSAVWTATALSKILGPTVTIDLLESDAVGTVGADEATIPTIHWFNDWTCFRKVESFPEMKGELDDEATTVYKGI
jgi:hypothetical protein